MAATALVLAPGYEPPALADWLVMSSKNPAAAMAPANCTTM